MSTLIQNNETILFIGDSITDCGRRENQHKPLGCGFVSMFNDMLLTRDSEKKITVINRGIGGNTIADLRSRWQDDVLAFCPNWLVAKVGINDINQYLSKQGSMPLPPETYEEIYDQLLALTRRRLPKCKILLIDSFYGSTDAIPGSYRASVAALLPKYLEAVSRLAKKYGTRHLKLQDIFMAKLKVQHPEIYFPSEPVHPLSTGHFLIAESVYAALEK
jgi:lysophospholipase L1-like esterase